MTRSNIATCLAAIVVFVALWALFNQPEMEPPWPSQIKGFAFSPMQATNDPAKGSYPTREEIDRDLGLLAGKTNAVRTYTVEDVLVEIPELAEKHDLNVTLGAWIGADLEKNEKQIETVIKLAKKHYRNVIRVVVGNEVVLRQELTVKQMNGYIKRVQDALDVPVSTAEPWHIWLKHPELTDHVDFIASHMLPYWEGIHVDKAVEHVVMGYELLRKTFPDKPVVITEVGWPSIGRTRGDAVASVANEATFLRRFLQYAEKNDYIYYVMEAFDQPWKGKSLEGAVGAYWGVYNANREPKFPFTQPIVGIPEWQLLAGVSVGIAAIIFMLLVIDSRFQRFVGSGFLASVAFMAASGSVWIIYSYSRQYLTLSSILIGVLLIFGLLGFIVVLLAEAHEWAESLWGTVGRRGLAPTTVNDAELPKVSVHIPAYNEPPEMMIETLNALADLDYPDFEVIVIDNNTKDEGVWRPVEEHCRKLGERFRFFHENPLAGFKAGALNYSLARTAEDAEVVAVIDSDYIVTRNWLRDLVPQFSRREVAIVQAPQDYRDSRENLFKAMCYAEYRGFFSIGMVTRNERNAIIQHGTMTMVRRSVLEEVGGWAEWCITEDAELGLRIFERGYEAMYVEKSYGRGLIPDTFIDFKKQRYRWAYGAMQIIKYHWRWLSRKGGSQLTFGQRYHFMAGWLPWIADAINLIFTLFALFWSVGMVNWPTIFEPPLLILTIVPITFFVFKVAKMFYLYQYRVSATPSQTIASAIAGLALTHTIAKSILYGFVTKSLPFFRTPKRAAGSSFLYAVNSAREELLIATALLLGAHALVYGGPVETTDMVVWIAILLVQSTPYVAAVVLSFISAFSRLPAGLVKPMDQNWKDSGEDIKSGALRS